MHIKILHAKCVAMDIFIATLTSNDRKMFTCNFIFIFVWVYRVNNDNLFTFQNIKRVYTSYFNVLIYK